MKMKTAFYKTALCLWFLALCASCQNQKNVAPSPDIDKNWSVYYVPGCKAAFGFSIPKNKSDNTDVLYVYSPPSLPAEMGSLPLKITHNKNGFVIAAMLPEKQRLRGKVVYLDNPSGNTVKAKFKLSIGKETMEDTLLLTQQLLPAPGNPGYIGEDTILSDNIILWTHFDKSGQLEKEETFDANGKLTKRVDYKNGVVVKTTDSNAGRNVKDNSK